MEKGRWYLGNLFEKQQIQDAQGGFNYTWAKVGQYWFKLIHLKGYDLYRYEKLDQKIDYKIVYRFPDEVKSGNKIEITIQKNQMFVIRTFEIRSAPLITDEKNQYMEVMAKEIF
jgi:SPP1 family predicted phage head-tail adaptor